MTLHQVAVMIAGFLCLIGSPILWYKLRMDGFVAFIMAFCGLCLIVDGHL